LAVKSDAPGLPSLWCTGLHFSPGSGRPSPTHGAGGSEQGSKPGLGLSASRATAFAAVLSIPLVSWGLYAWVGAPDLPSQPLAARLSVDPAKAPIEELIARAEAHLSNNPGDGHGWDVLAPVYFRVGRYADSINAYSQAGKLLGDSSPRLTGLGEDPATPRM